jgi:hypothetical protein
VPSARPKHPGRRPAFAERGARQGLFPGSGHSILYPISSGSNSWR